MFHSYSTGPGPQSVAPLVASGHSTQRFTGAETSTPTSLDKSRMQVHNGWNMHSTSGVLKPPKRLHDAARCCVPSGAAPWQPSPLQSTGRIHAMLVQLCSPSPAGGPLKGGGPACGANVCTIHGLNTHCTATSNWPGCSKKAAESTR
jgi:hypothetical protein